MLRARRIPPTALVLVLVAPLARALEGAPPFEWQPWGWPVPELVVAVTIAADAGAGAGFAEGSGERSMRARDYTVTPVQVRYGVFPALEIYGVAQLVWASAPESWTDPGSSGTPVTYRQVVSGFDGGDMAVGLRWGVVRTDGDAVSAVLTAAFLFPSGSDVWSYPRTTFIRTFGETPDLSTGDGTYKILAGVEVDAGGEDWGLETQAGYLLKLPVDAAAVAPPASTIEVRMPSPVIARIRPAWKVSDEVSVLGVVEGYWAPAGKFVLGGELARYPGDLATTLDSYMNLVAGEAGLWAGAGLRWGGSTSPFAAALCLAAPVAASRVWRQWRLGATVTWSWKPQG
jgi:hypothetical protein